jgi:hypothetical protein
MVVLFNCKLTLHLFTFYTTCIFLNTNFKYGQTQAFEFHISIFMGALSFTVFYITFCLELGA